MEETINDLSSDGKFLFETILSILGQYPDHESFSGGPELPNPEVMDLLEAVVDEGFARRVTRGFNNDAATAADREGSSAATVLCVPEGL